MARVHALLVGIDNYQEVPPLRGCVNDILDAERYLKENIGAIAGITRLLNEQATRNAIIDGFRNHLGKAGPGDTALFWFSGHGSTAPVPPEWWHLEGSGTTMQTLVCADSRIDGTPDLLDKEVAMLIRELAARGPHVAVVLDCCYAGGATRMVPSIRARAAEPLKAPPHVPSLLDGLVSGRGLPAMNDRADHVALAACREDELARELPDRDGIIRGVFSVGLLAELRRPGPARTYRALTAAARAYAENVVDRQTPVLYPSSESIVDQPFLGGKAQPPVVTMTMRERRGQWIVDAGACHGLVSGAGADMARVAVHGSDPALEAWVVRVDADHCVVDPIGWQPVPGTLYPVVVSNIAMPATTVAVGGGAGDDESAARQIKAVISSPFLRLVPHGDPHFPAELVVSTPRHRDLTVRSTSGEWLANSPATGNDWQPEIVRRLEHIARWRTIRALSNPLSRLADLVQVEILVPGPHEYRTPKQRKGLLPNAHGAIELEYDPNEYGFTPPSVFIRIDNLSHRRLHCVLLDLTDGFRIHASLFPGAFVDAGASAAAGEGDLIELSLPEHRVVKPGARVRDWLMLIVSEEKINSDHFAMQRLGEPPAGNDRGLAGLAGIVDRLAVRAQHRDADRESGAASDWWTSVTSLVTSVPGEPEQAVDPLR